MPVKSDANIHSIVLVDPMPDQQAQGTNVLVNFVREARQDETVRAITLIRQTDPGNHYVIDMTFAHQSAYYRFIQSPYVRGFRVALFEHLGSPWDERVGSDIIL
ncbi:hypothetical protein [Lichenibacterium dinghuense]|uniref:hypothetical protein n=1 Tax=Lichenibacterium dinghuense TaxID=2895977 RepID=UPI001F46753C|nr:hypothetical protein [Lichenibacterium sp. 6Y81]